MATCRHPKTKVTETTVGYRWPVSRNENRAAHGGVCHVERCECGAVRYTNACGGHYERGSWLVDGPDGN